MTRIPDDFWQMGESENPLIVQLGETTVYLVGGAIVNPKFTREFTPVELKLFLRLHEKHSVTKRGYLSARYLAEYLYSYPYILDMKRPEHAIEQMISKMRHKLGEPNYHPKYLIGSRDKGYRLNLPDGCSTASLSLVRKLLDLLKFR